MINHHLSTVTHFIVFNNLSALNIKYKVEIEIKTTVCKVVIKESNEESYCGKIESLNMIQQSEKESVFKGDIAALVIFLFYAGEKKMNHWQSNLLNKLPLKVNPTTERRKREKTNDVIVVTLQKEVRLCCFV